MPDLAQIAGDVLGRVRRESPRVHCLTNTVAEALTANVLLAAGGIPSMTTHPAEVGAFVEGAGGLLVNLGTPDAERNTAIGLALDAAQHAGVPWVLDPVLIDRSPLRLDRARQLLARTPAVVRGNAGEIDALFANQVPACVVAKSGAEDIIAGGGRTARVRNGHPWMAQVTAMGCAMSALIAAFSAVHEDHFEAAAAALLVTGVSGDLAAAKAKGPGSFVPGFLDELAGLSAHTLATEAACEEEENA
ncbi:MAG: hydroxyethylthiazole kinase [Pseudomonadota bacterium]